VDADGGAFRDDGDIGVPVCAHTGAAIAKAAARVAPLKSCFINLILPMKKEDASCYLRHLHSGARRAPERSAHTAVETIQANLVRGKATDSASLVTNFGAGCCIYVEGSALVAEFGQPRYRVG